MMSNREYPLSLCLAPDKESYTITIEACVGAHFSASSDAWEGGHDMRGVLCIEEPSPPVTPIIWEIKVVRKSIGVEDCFRQVGHFGDRSTGIHYVYAYARR